MGGRAVACLCLLIVGSAVAAPEGLEGEDALRDVLVDSTVVVRGSALEAPVPVAEVEDTRFAVHEVLRGRVDGNTITVRQPTRPDGSPARLGIGEEVILLLDARASDGTYSIHDHPVGRYRVGTGELVHVNAIGVDGSFFPAKDNRPGVSDALITLDDFRAVAASVAPPAAAAAPNEPAATPRARAVAPVPPAAAAATDEPSHTSRWWYALVALVAAGAVLVAARRARR